MRTSKHHYFHLEEEKNTFQMERRSSSNFTGRWQFKHIDTINHLSEIINHELDLFCLLFCSFLFGHSQMLSDATVTILQATFLLLLLLSLYLTCKCIDVNCIGAHWIMLHIVEHPFLSRRPIAQYRAVLLSSSTQPSLSVSLCMCLCVSVHCVR